MANIIPDDIRRIDDMSPQTGIIYHYIKYMREQLEFWASRKEQDLIDLRAGQTVTPSSEEDLDEILQMIEQLQTDMENEYTDIRNDSQNIWNAIQSLRSGDLKIFDTNNNQIWPTT